MVQLGGFLGKPLEPLLKNGLPVMKNVLRQSAKNVLIPLRLAATAADAGIHKKHNRIGDAPTYGTLASFELSTVNNNFENEIRDIAKIIKCLKKSALLVKGFLSMIIRYIRC